MDVRFWRVPAKKRPEVYKMWLTDTDWSSRSVAVVKLIQEVTHKNTALTNFGITWKQKKHSTIWN